MSHYFSIIVPVYNEQENILPLYDKIKSVMSAYEKWEVLFIDDGSKDKSAEVLDNLADSEKPVRVIHFLRNFGQTAAWAAGFDNAKGDVLITMDADGQNDPEDIPKMMELMVSENADVVTGWRKDRKDPFLRSIMSKVANRFVNWVTRSNIKDSGCSLRLIKKSAIKNITLYGEMHRLLPFLLSGYGLKIVETVVKHHPRVAGVSKYGFSRTFKVLMDVIVVKFLTSYQTKPIYMFGIVGLLQILLAFVSGIFIVIRAFVWGGDLVSPLFAVSAMMFAYGIVSIFLGLMMEVQIRSWYESTGKKSYEIKE